ncbi:MAG: radical SAM protein [Desulfobacterales bacterium]|nr:radical SAM protein [Desulfobacterales bacterium]
MKINEIFHSIQGESLNAGIPCVFVRLTGCNLRCKYCDTRYAYNEGFEISIPEIIDKVDDFNCNLVEITGGEPLFQEETPLLIRKLLNRGHVVLLETNGSYDIRIVDQRCIRIVDIKCPGSGEADKNNFRNLKYVTLRDQIKFVVGSREDYDFAKKVSKMTKNSFPQNSILFSPMNPALKPEELAGWILEDHLEVRLHLQLHKIIWPNIDRGV